jgi:hypothetical protein
MRRLAPSVLEACRDRVPVLHVMDRATLSMSCILIKLSDPSHDILKTLFAKTHQGDPHVTSLLSSNKLVLAGVTSAFSVASRRNGNSRADSVRLEFEMHLDTLLL